LTVGRLLVWLGPTAHGQGGLTALMVGASWSHAAV